LIVPEEVAQGIGDGMDMQEESMGAMIR